MGFAGDDQSLVTEDKMREVFAELNDDDEGGTGDERQRAMWNQRLGQAYKNITDYQSSAPMTEDQRRANTKAYYQEVQDMAGPDPSKAQADRIAGLETQQIADLGQQKGLAALAAIPTVLQGGNALRGLGGGAGALAGMYGKALQADRAEKRALMSMKNNLEDAQYKTRLGMVGEARQLTAEARRDTQAAGVASVKKQEALGKLAAQGVKLNAPPKGATPNFDIQNRELMAADLKATTPMKKGETPEQYEKRLNAMAAREIYGAKGTKDITSRSNVTSTVSSTSDIAGNKADVEEKKADTSAMAAEEASLKDARADLARLKRSNIPKNQKKWQDLLKEHGSEQAAGEAHIKNYMVTNPTAAAPAAKAADAPKQVLPPNTTTGKFVQGKGTEVLNKAGEVIGYAN
jgi:hypothetical protein